MTSAISIPNVKFTLYFHFWNKILFNKLNDISENLISQPVNITYIPNIFALLNNQNIDTMYELFPNLYFNIIKIPATPYFNNSEWKNSEFKILNSLYNFHQTKDPCYKNIIISTVGNLNYSNFLFDNASEILQFYSK